MNVTGINWGSVSHSVVLLPRGFVELQLGFSFSFSWGSVSPTGINWGSVSHSVSHSMEQSFRLFTTLVILGFTHSGLVCAQIGDQPLAKIHILKTTLALHDSASIRAYPSVLGIQVTFFLLQTFAVISLQAIKLFYEIVNWVSVCD